jgi:hypothetical protein
VIGAVLVFAPTRWVGHFSEHIGAVRGGLYQLEAQTIAAILGFLIAAAAILGTAGGIQRLRTERYAVYKLLIRSFTSSMAVSVIALVYDVAAFVGDQDVKSTSVFVVVGFVLFLIVSLRILRAVRRLYQSLSI